MIPVTKMNYFGDNRGLTQSKIKDYLKCPNYFYRNNIEHSIEREDKKCYDIGTIVDNILTEQDNLDNYVVVEGDGRTKEVKELKQQYLDAGKKIINQQQYDTIINCADSVLKSSAYSKIIKDNFTMQEIIQIENNDLGEYFDSLLGKPDAYKIEDGVCTLIDFKTTMTVDDRKFWYKFKEYGYDLQLNFYAWLLAQKYSEIETFKFYILAQEVQEPYGVKLFNVPEEYVKKQDDTISAVIKLIKDNKFDKADASFESPTLLYDPKDADYFIEESQD